MAGGPINITRFLSQQGLDPKMTYEAQVVNNNDPRKLGRIQARIAGIFDGIPDEHLPWSVPMYHHADGAYNPGGDAVDRAGSFMVPKNLHKVGLRFPTADPHRCIWGPYTVDEQVELPEKDKNYPNRAVVKFSNGMYMIIDTETNEIFFNNPGDMDITILGDVNQYIVGNQQLVVTDSMSDIPSYLLNAPDTVLSRLSPKPAKEIPFLGLLGPAQRGNRHIHVTGDQTMQVDGNRKTVINGQDLLVVKKNRIEKISQIHRIECARSETNG
jgi:hypothetical protein